MNPDLSNNPLFQALESQKMKPRQVSQPVSSELESNPLFQALQGQAQTSPQQQQKRFGDMNPAPEGSLLNRTETKKGKSIHGGQRGPVKELIGGTYDAMTRGQDRIDRIMESGAAARRGEISYGRSALQSMGQTLGMAGDTIGGGFIKALEMLLPESAERLVSKPVNKTIGKVANTQFVQDLNTRYSELPEQARNDIDAATSAVNGLLELAGAGTLGVGAQATVSAGRRTLNRAASTVAQEGLGGLASSAVSGAKNIAGDAGSAIFDTVARRVDEPLKNSIERTLRGANLNEITPEEAMSVLGKTEKRLVELGFGGEDIQRTLGAALVEANYNKYQSKLAQGFKNILEDGNRSPYKNALQHIKTMGSDMDTYSDDIVDVITSLGNDPRNYLNKQGFVNMIKYGEDIVDLAKRDFEKVFNSVLRDDTIIDIRNMKGKLRSYLSRNSDFVNKSGISADEIENVYELARRKIDNLIGSKKQMNASEMLKLASEISNDFDSVSNNQARRAIRNLLQDMVYENHPNKTLVEALQESNKLYGKRKDVADTLSKMGNKAKIVDFPGFEKVAPMAVAFAGGAAASSAGMLSPIGFVASYLVAGKGINILRRQYAIRALGGKSFMGVAGENLFKRTPKISGEELSKRIDDSIITSRKARADLQTNEVRKATYESVITPEIPIPKEMIDEARKEISDSISVLSNIKKVLTQEKRSLLNTKKIDGFASKRQAVEIDFELSELQKELDTYKAMLDDLPTALPNASPNLQATGMDELNRTNLFR